MKLSKLLNDYIKVDAHLDQEILGLTADSRKVTSGDVFFACKGLHVDGSQFIEQAIAKGAKAILCEAQNKDTNITQQQNIPLISIPALSQKLGFIAANFYADPSKDMCVIGVTGTSGKTSVTQYLATILTMAGCKAGIIGTLGSGMVGKLEDNGFTTPEPITLQKNLAQLRDEGAKYVAMEVSSHGLAQGRHHGIHFDMGIFTNLTRDHLDFHRNMRAYGAAKAKLFKETNIKQAIINADDKFGMDLIHKIHTEVPVYSYSSQGKIVELSIQQIKSHKVKADLRGITAGIYSPWGDGVLHSQLRGRFNLNNLLAVFTAGGILNVPFVDLLSYLPQLQPVVGRMEFFGGGEQPYVVVDYAHKPDALQQVLVALRECCTGEIWCVFGAGGDRDKGKRALMGECAERYADHLIITDDNPRTENPQEIIADILQGITQSASVIIEHDRHRAIAHAISCAQPQDVVLVAGKGHEKYQIIGTEKLPFNDELVVQMVLAENKL